ncbi:MAG TPA: hypothetical protein VMH00_12660 [Candidatus Limnocylindrales bacterium]|nr:hypothetical protein [Candidatus Limnocylindrales bacterium]
MAAMLASLPCATQAQGTARTDGWVVIPLEEYRALHARAFPGERPPEQPPVEATLTRVEYNLQIHGGVASGAADLTVDVLKNGWVRVPIPTGLLIREAKLEGKPVSLVAGGQNRNGQVCALLSHSGRATLALEVDLPVESTAGEESIALPATASGVTKATIELPQQGVDVKLSGGLLVDTSAAGAQSKWLAYGRGGEPLRFAWHRKTEDHRAEQPLRLRGSLTELVGLGEDSTAISAEADIEVTQGVAKAVQIEIPANVTINQVQGAMVADWEAKDGELTVTFLEPVEQSTRFEVAGETRTPREGEIAIPVLRLKDAERETGGVAVDVLGAGEIKDSKMQGLEAADATDLGAMVASRESPSLAAFRFRAGDAQTARTLRVDVARYTPQAVLMANIEEARYQILMSNDGKTLAQARYAVRNNERNFLKVTLPAGATLWSASLAGRPVRPGQAPDGGLLLPLEKAKAGGAEDSPAFEVEVVYVMRGAPWGEKGQAALALPAVDLPISRTGLVLYYPPLFKVTPEAGAFRTEAYENPSSPTLSGSLNGGVSGGVGYGMGPAATPRPADKDDANTRALVDQFRAESPSGKVAGILPVQVSFPAFGPSVFLVSELTGENQAPAAELNYQREKKGGAR